MSTLRKCLTRPHTYLAVLVCFFAAAMLDSYRSPPNQWTSRAYVKAVRLYQKYGRPLTSRYIRCRYRPTCSEYSLQAVETHGIRRGLSLTYQRLASCTTAVPLGTDDPVPPPFTGNRGQHRISADSR
jgi:putative membrane protein insertion efficiency factor